MCSRTPRCVCLGFANQILTANKYCVATPKSSAKRGWQKIAEVICKVVKWALLNISEIVMRGRWWWGGWDSARLKPHTVSSPCERVTPNLGEKTQTRCCWECNIRLIKETHKMKWRPFLVCGCAPRLTTWSGGRVWFVGAPRDLKNVYQTILQQCQKKSARRDVGIVGLKTLF